MPRAGLKAILPCRSPSGHTLSIRTKVGMPITYGVWWRRRFPVSSAAGVPPDIRSIKGWLKRRELAIKVVAYNLKRMLLGGYGAGIRSSESTFGMKPDEPQPF